MEATSISSSQRDNQPLSDPVAESRRLIDVFTRRNVVARLLGGAAVYLQAPAEGPILARPVRDIDIATRRGARTAATETLKSAGYVPDQMFNALHGARRLLFYDEANVRKLDVFVGDFSMCHQVPIADRLEKEPLTIPLAELLLTKLQIVELTERDQRDIYNLTYHHPVTNGGGGGIEANYIAEVCARDWGLWRTTNATLERCRSGIGEYGLDDAARERIGERLASLSQRIEAEPKTGKWKLRNRVGDRMRWYDEPEEHPQQGR